MKNFLKQLYHAHPNNILLKGARFLAHWAKDLGYGARAVIHLLYWKLTKGSSQLPIRVCFVQQDPNCWNKSRALFDLLHSDHRFQVSLLCVPDPFDPDTASTYRFYREQGYDAIDARIGDGPWATQTSQGDWLDLQTLKPDYVFYQQPYNPYLPAPYRTGAVSKYAKICLTPYGFALTKEFLSRMPSEFFRDVYRLYALSELEKEDNIRRFPLSHKLGLRESHYFSPLVFADFFRNKESESPSWSFSKNDFRVIWTPRWTTDRGMGGSNFFRYKDFLPAYADSHPDMDLLFRPHPMAFDNFIRTGQMTEEEVAAYIAGCNNRSNTALDKEKSYDATFWQSSVLLTDLSAIIVEYFVTGKPIIFCETENRINAYVDSFETMLTACYIAYNSEDIDRYLSQLKAGDDPLAPRRQQIITQLFGKDPTQAPQRVREDLLQDHAN